MGIGAGKRICASSDAVASDFDLNVALSFAGSLLGTVSAFDLPLSVCCQDSRTCLAFDDESGTHPSLCFQPSSSISKANSESELQPLLAVLEVDSARPRLAISSYPAPAFDAMRAPKYRLVSCVSV